MKTRFAIVIAVAVAGICQAACNPETGETAATGPEDKTGTAQAKPSQKIETTALSLTGLTMQMPKTWKKEPAAGGPMGPKAVLTIENADGSKASIRITYFPNMKGMNEPNIQRWIGQVTKPDGSTYTRDEAKVQAVDLDSVQLTVVDLSGKVRATMAATPQPDHRMIAAIVDHEKGPHFVVAAGPKDLMATAAPDIMSFLKSAKPR